MVRHRPHRAAKLHLRSDGVPSLSLLRSVVICVCGVFMFQHARLGVPLLAFLLLFFIIFFFFLFLVVFLVILWRQLVAWDALGRSESSHGRSLIITVQHSLIRRALTQLVIVVLHPNKTVRAY
jgi:hypothetical protein